MSWLSEPLSAPSDPMRIIVYGEPGVGKSVLAAAAPRPLVICAELPGNEAKRIIADGGGRWSPQPKTFDELRSMVADAQKVPSRFDTLIIEGLREVGALIEATVCAGAKVAHIEDVGGGYGKGYSAALDLWRIFMRDLETLQAQTGWPLILVGHHLTKSRRNPSGEDYTMISLDLQDGPSISAARTLVRWASDVLFVQHDLLVGDVQKKRGTTGTGKLITTGRRVIHSQSGSGPWEAKTRNGLPPVVDLPMPPNGGQFWARLFAKSDEVKARIETLLGELGERIDGARVLADMATAGGDTVRLRQIETSLNRLKEETP